MSLFQKTHTTHLRIQGMTCGNCQRHVKEALESVPGVKRAHVDLEGGRAEVQATDKATHEALGRAVADAGYSAEPVQE